MLLWQGVVMRPAFRNYTDPILVFPKTDTKSYNMSAKQLRLTVEANLVPGKT